MKKVVFASAMALASMSLVSTPALRAQDSGQISLPADQYNAYQNFATQTDPAQKCAAGESFLTAYPQTPVKAGVLDALIGCYGQSNQPDKVLSAASRLLQVDPNNMHAIGISVYLKKSACAKSLDAPGGAVDTQSCDDAAALAQKGLAAPKPAGTSDDDWKKLTTGIYPIFHSAIAFDALSKKDYAAAIKEFNTELMIYPPDACKTAGPCLGDTLQLAQAYAKPGPAKDEVKAVWFFARFLDFAPPAYKTQIDPLLDYWYKRYHGTLDGDAAIKQQIAAIETQAQSTLFPPDNFTIAPAPSNQDLANKYCSVGPDDLKKLALEDKEFLLANGSKDCTDKLWPLMKGQPTPVPGVVISAPASALKITVTTAASVKPKEFDVKLTNPVACSAVPVPPTELKIKEAQDYILANGVKADTDAMGDVLTETPAHIRKLVVEPAVTAVDVAVTQDAKDANKADFIVNLKDPVPCKDAPQPGSALALQPAMELDGTYDSYTSIPGAGTTAASAQIVLSDGFIQQVAKKGAPVHHTVAKPPAAHRPGM